MILEQLKVDAFCVCNFKSFTRDLAVSYHSPVLWDPSQYTCTWCNWLIRFLQEATFLMTLLLFISIDVYFCWAITYVRLRMIPVVYQIPRTGADVHYLSLRNLLPVAWILYDDPYLADKNKIKICIIMLLNCLLAK